MRVPLLPVANACQDVPVAVLIDMIASFACLLSIKNGMPSIRNGTLLQSVQEVSQTCAGAA